MKLFNKTYKIRKFVARNPQINGIDEITGIISGMSHDLLDDVILENGDCTLQPIENYACRIVMPGQIIVGELLVMLFSVCKRKINANELDLCIRKKLAELQANDPKTEYTYEDVRKNYKKHFIEVLRSEKAHEYDLKPIMYNMNTKEGFIFGASETVAKKAIEYVSQIFGNCEVELVPFLEEGDFLTWLWWRTSANPNKEALGSEVVSLGVVDMLDADKVERIQSTSDNLEECRLALLRGLRPVKFGVGFVYESNIKRVTYQGNSVLCIKDDNMAKFEENEIAAYLDIFDTIGQILKITEELKNEFKVEKLSNDQISFWSRGDFCTRNFNDI